MNSMQARQIDESHWFVLDREGNVLHGEDGGPFPYRSKRVAASVAARKNGRFGKRRYVPVTWLTLSEG